MKRIIIISIILILISITTIVIITKKPNNNINYDNINTEPIVLKLNDFLENKSNYINYIEDNIIYGKIERESEFQYFKTSLLYTYNITNEEYNAYPLNDKECIIMDFYKLNDKFYYIEMSLEESAVNWKLNISDLEFKNIKTIKEGNVLSDLNVPQIYTDTSKNIYLLAMNNDNDNEETNIYKIDGEKLESLIKFKGNHKTKKGQFIQNMLYTSGYGDNISFALVEDYKTTSAYTFNLKTKELHKFITSNIEELYYRSYFFTKDGCFLNVNDENDKISNMYIDWDGNITNYQYNDDIKFGRNLDDENMLFHEDNKWYILNTKTKEIKEIKIENKDFGYNYYVVDKDTIIALGKYGIYANNKYYSIDIPRAD